MATSLVSNLGALYARLTKPPVHTENVATHLQMRLISSLFLFQAILAFLIVIVYRPVQIDAIAHGASIGFGVMSLVCYFLSRTQFYKHSIYLYIALMMVALFSLFVTNSNNPDAIPEYTLSYLIAIIFFTSILLSVRATVIVSAVSLLGIGLIPLVVAELLYPIHFLWLFVLVTSILIVVTTNMRHNVFRRLHESENQARSLMEAYIDAVVIHHQEQGILAVNPSFSTLLGYKADEIMNHKIESLANNQQSKSLISANAGLDYKSRPYEVELLHKNGESIIVELMNQPYEYNNQMARVFVIRDMRQYKEAIRQQHENETRYQSLLELTDDAVFIMDFEGKYIVANQRGADMLLVPLDDLIGQSFHDFVPKAYHSASERVIERLLKGESVPMYERTLVKANGHRFPVEVMVRLLRDVNGEPEFVYSVVRDISERKRMEDQRIELAVERERMSTLQSFLKDASHYFRTPLTSLKTSQYLLTQIRDNPQKQQHFLDVIKLEVARLERLISDMMLSTQLEQDAGDGLTFGRLDLAKVLPEIIDTFTPSEKRDHYAELVIEPKIPEKSLFIMASRAKLSVALHRIIDNAVTYSPEDSQVTIRAYQNQQNICIAITDQGIGITEDEMPDLFRRFRRADRAIEMAHVGNGLGLFIAKKIIEMHYGEIHVESKLDEGSTFTVCLPMAFRPGKKSDTQPRAISS